MADYIDRQQALGYPLSYDHYDKKNGDIKFINGVESYREYIEGLPSVDAVKVVRCKDCKFNGYNGEHHCVIHDINIAGNYYCASGVKKNEIN